MQKSFKETFNSIPSNVKFAVLVASLGYFVDVFDLILFTVVRVKSLKDIGVPDEQLLSNGVFLLNIQLAGLLIGGIFWGVLGDKFGRIQVLFGSILIYSLANIANAFAGSVEFYAYMRFLAGLGLAGEIGAGITLVSELLSKENRGIGTTIVATVGVAGALFAGLLGDFFNWRIAYIVGGVMGLMLLVLRVSVCESGVFSKIKEQKLVKKGSLKMLFTDKRRFYRLLQCVLIGTPVWFTVGIVITFCPEIGSAHGIATPLKASFAVISYSVGITLGDLFSGLLSQQLRSRKKVITIFIICSFVCNFLILNLSGISDQLFYGLCVPLGFFIGYWAVIITNAAEQFGTNLRATVATTTPNFIRSTAIIMTFFFQYFRPYTGVLISAQIVGLAVYILALYANFKMEETFGRDLNFIED